MSEQEYEPKSLTDEAMIDMFNKVEKHEDFRPYKAEIEQFFESRIWKTVEQEATVKMAQLFNTLLKPRITERELSEVASMIRMLAWWINLKDNLFLARQRSLDLDSATPGGQSWAAE